MSSNEQSLPSEGPPSGQVPSEEAGRRVKVARLLRHCPVLASALASGRVGVDHVRVIANATNSRNLHVVVAVQQQLIDLTGEVVLFRFWAQQVLDLLRLVDSDGPEPTVEDNHLHLDRQFDGTSRLTGTLTAETRDVVTHAIDTFTDRIFRRYKTDADQIPEDIEIPARSTLAALALAEICRTALCVTHSGSGTAADVTYVIHAEDPAIVWNSDGERVESATAHLACCDAPGRHTDLHHVQHWDHDGPTDLDNLVCLCRHHHGVVHRKDWHMNPAGHQRFTITTPTGRTLNTQRHGSIDSAA